MPARVTKMNIRYKGRNDLDLPDEMVVHYDLEKDRITFKFSSGIKSFTPDDLSFEVLHEIIDTVRVRK